MRAIVLLCLVSALCAITPTALLQTHAQERPRHAWWNAPRPAPNRPDPSLTALPVVRVNGSRFVNAHGDTILFRGLAIADPDKIEGQGHWGKDLFSRVKEMGAMVVRIPIHPVAWRERTPARYLALLDQAIAWCTELGMYVMIDWHSIGNLRMGLFQDPMYITTLQETNEFWYTIARHFRGHHTPAFYELFNEPTLFNGQLGRMSWSEWKKINEDIIGVIRAFDKDKIILVAGLDWAYDLTPLLIEPLEADAIGYVTHPYPHKRTPPYEPKWEENFGFAASRYPVVATEFGFTFGNESLTENGEYGTAIISYLEGKGISWVGWVFDPDWSPRLITSWDSYALTESGAFFKKALQGHVAPPGKQASPHAHD